MRFKKTVRRSGMVLTSSALVAVGVIGAVAVAVVGYIAGYMAGLNAAVRKRRYGGKGEW